MKSELLDGEIFAMTGGSLAHAQIASNLIRELGLALKGTGCRVLGSDMRLSVQRSKLFTYPDVTVVCGPAGMTLLRAVGFPARGLSSILYRTKSRYRRYKKRAPVWLSGSPRGRLRDLTPPVSLRV